MNEMMNDVNNDVRLYRKKRVLEGKCIVNKWGLLYQRIKVDALMT